MEAASKRWQFITVFLAFERPSRLQWTRLHPLACYDNETQRGKCDKLKVPVKFTEQQRSASMPPTRRLFVIFANNRGSDISIVDVPSHHCALPQLKTTIRRQCTYVRVVLGGVAMHRRIRKFLLRGSWPFIQNFAPTKISLYMVPSWKKIHLVTLGSFLNTHIYTFIEHAISIACYEGGASSRG